MTCFYWLQLARWRVPSGNFPFSAHGITTPQKERRKERKKTTCTTLMPPSRGGGGGGSGRRVFSHLNPSEISLFKKWQREQQPKRERRRNDILRPPTTTAEQQHIDNGRLETAQIVKRPPNGWPFCRLIDASTSSSMQGSPTAATAAAAAAAHRSPMLTQRTISFDSQ